MQADNDITVNTAVTMQSGVSLKLAAINNVNVNANVTTSGGGNLRLEADTDASGVGAVTLGSVTIDAPLIVGDLGKEYSGKLMIGSNVSFAQDAETFGLLTYSAGSLSVASGKTLTLKGGMKRPDHHTINRFRGQRLKNNIREVFTQVVLLLMEAGHVDLKAVYTDGTKLEANANKYTFVWAKSIATNKKKMKARLEELWDYAQGVAAEELRGEDPGEMQELDPQKVEQTIDAINAALKGKPVEKEVQQKLSYARKNWGPNLRKYRMQELILGERGSYSKTDPHATFMRMKDDHMGNGQLKAGYNVQWSTQDQFIVHYSLHQDTTDTKTLIPHYEQLKAQLGKLPGAAVADAGYGSEQNYEYLEAESVEAFVKYNYFHREQQKSHQEKYPFEQGRLYYNAARNEYTCPMGQPMRHIGDQRSTTKAGHPQNVSRYQAHNCAGCPLNGACHKAKGNRIIEVNHRLNQLKAQARELLTSEEGLRHRSTRPIEVESAFGNLKQNKGFTRFMLRGLHKVTLEIGLLSTAG